MTKVIVEGPDGGGKTTLLQQLMQEFPGELKPRVVDKDTNALVDLKAWVEDDVSDMSTVVDEGIANGFVFYDRHRLISEPIYGPILRDEQQPGFTDFVWVQSMLRKLKDQYPILIYCLPPPKVVERNLFSDPDNTAIYNNWEAIYTSYLTRAALDKLGPGGHRVFIYDYTNSHPKALHIRSYLYKEMESYS